MSQNEVFPNSPQYRYTNIVNCVLTVCVLSVLSVKATHRIALTKVNLINIHGPLLGVMFSLSQQVTRLYVSDVYSLK